MLLNEERQWYIMDSSKINDYLDCPRQFFYRHVVGWVPDVVSHHLIFGEAYHKIMEELLDNGYNEGAITIGFKEFMKVWRRTFSPDQDNEKAPKTPSMALRAAMEYIVRYANDEEDYEPLMTEISGSAPLNEGATEWWERIHFRIDAVLKHHKQGFILVREHKTATANTRQYANQWALDVQPGTYTHAAYCIYSPDKVWGVQINTTFFKKSGLEFVRIPVRKTPGVMQVWHNIVTGAIADYRADLAALESATVDHQTLTAFRLNPRSCTKYYGCAYLDFCTSWPNPLQRIDEIPQGFTRKFWDPAEEYKSSTKIIL